MLGESSARHWARCCNTGHLLPLPCRCGGVGRWALNARRRRRRRPACPQFWKSNPNHWCEYCKVWMTDNAQSRAVHERGVKHQEAVARSESAAAGASVPRGGCWRRLKLPGVLGFAGGVPALA